MYGLMDVFTCVFICVECLPLRLFMLYHRRYTKGTRAHTHRELIRKWLWEPKGSSLEYI